MRAATPADGGATVSIRREMPSVSARIPYRREIDGLRAVAVGAVVLFHAGFDAFSGGYVGVDVFFVISGYLITSIIVAENRAGQFSIAGFYERRARRILPALFLTAAACTPFCWAWMMPDQLADFSNSLLATLVFGSNAYFDHTIGYFAKAADQKVLLHTWSLAVEEQYYLVVPLALTFLLRHASRPRIVAILTALAMVSLLLAERQWRASAESGFYLTHLRVWEIGIGAILALLGDRERLKSRAVPAMAGLLALIGAGLVILAIVQFDNDIPMPSLYTLLPTVGAALIIAFANPSNLVGRVLSGKWLVAGGLISYGVYLWHFPLFALARIRFDYRDGDVLAAVVIVSLTIALAALSFHFVEAPLRSRRVSRAQIVAGCCGFAAVAFGFGLAGAATGGFPDRMDDVQAARYAALLEARRPALDDDRRCVFQSNVIDHAFIEEFRRCANEHGKGLIVLGDSHAGNLFDAVRLNTDRPFVAALWKGGCRPSQPRPGCPLEGAVGLAAQFKDRIDAILYTQSGIQFLTRKERLPVVPAAVHGTRDYLSQLSRDVRVIWLGPQVEPNVDLRKLNIMFRSVSRDDRSKENRDIEAVDDALVRFSEGQSYTYISKAKLIDYAFDRDFQIDGKFTYRDTDHWSSFGAKVYGLRLLADPLLHSLLTAPQAAAVN